MSIGCSFLFFAIANRQAPNAAISILEHFKLASLDFILTCYWLVCWILFQAAALHFHFYFHFPLEKPKFLVLASSIPTLIYFSTPNHKGFSLPLSRNPPVIQYNSSMPRLDDSREALLHAGQGIQKRAKRAWDGFSDFALRDNVLEVAVGLMYNPVP